MFTSPATTGTVLLGSTGFHLSADLQPAKLFLNLVAITQEDLPFGAASMNAYLLTTM